MGKLVDGDDGLPVELVGTWAKEKVDLLCKYIDISRSTRAKYLPPIGTGGAAYIDLFCGPGRARIKDTEEYIDSGAVAAWKKSRDGGAPFSRLIIGDADAVRLGYCVERLHQLDAPVLALHGPALDTAFRARQGTPVYGLNFAFLDPYNLEALNFQVIDTIAKIPRIDMLVHVSAMDLQRNLDKQLTLDDPSFEAFAPGWREAIRVRSKARTRGDFFDYWRELVGRTGAYTSKDVRLVTGSKNQPLYWLLVAAKHDLAHKFWDEVVNGKQRSLF